MGDLEAPGHHRHTQVGVGEVGGGLAHAPFRVGDRDVHVGQVPNHRGDSTCNRLGCLLHGSYVCHDQSHSFSRLLEMRKKKKNLSSKESGTGPLPWYPLGVRFATGDPKGW